MADFDAIVVGSGCAGSIAALELARAGKSVLVVERGNFAGAKNMTGGRIYGHCLRGVFPDNFDEIPFERKVTHEKISLMAPDANFTVDFTSREMLQDGKESYTVLRATFDVWLAEQAEDAGAEYICGIAVEKLIKDDTGRVIGIMAGEDEITSDVVILCDGANSLLAEQAVGAKKPAANMMAVGIKEVFELSEEEINKRFNVADGEGVSWLFAGDATHGSFGGGIIYTNKSSISLGLVAGIEATATKATTPVYQMLEDFKNRPEVKEIIKGAKLVEHSGHMVPEGGITTMPKLIADGVMLAGDNATMCINLGYTVRGMDYAVAAGQMAGRSAAQALDAGDTSEAGLSIYTQALEESFVMKDLRQFNKVPAFMEGFERMFKGYPEMMRDVMNTMFIVDGTPVKPLKKSMKPIIKDMGVMNLIKDVRGAMKAL